MKQLDVKPQAYVKRLVCDRCAREAEHEDFEFFEFLSFANKGGYGSVFQSPCRAAFWLRSKALAAVSPSKFLCALFAKPISTSRSVMP